MRLGVRKKLKMIKIRGPASCLWVVIEATAITRLNPLAASASQPSTTGIDRDDRHAYESSI